MIFRAACDLKFEAAIESLDNLVARNPGRINLSAGGLLEGEKMASPGNEAFFNIQSFRAGRGITDVCNRYCFPPLRPDNDC